MAVHLTDEAIANGFGAVLPEGFGISVRLVGARGFEPPTSSSRTMRATKLRHAPTEGARLQGLRMIAHGGRTGTWPLGGTRVSSQASARPGSRGCPRASRLAERLYARSVPHWPLLTVYGSETSKVPRQPVPQVAMTCWSTSVCPRGVDQRDAERSLEDVGVAGDSARVADRGAVGRSVDEDRRQLVVVVGASLRSVEDDALAAEDGDGLALDLEDDRLDRRELGERVDDLRKAVTNEVEPPPESNSVERSTVAMPFSMVMPRRSRAIRDRRAHRPVARFGGRRPGQERVHRRPSRRRSSWAPRAGPGRDRRCRVRRRGRSRRGRSWSRTAAGVGAAVPPGAADGRFDGVAPGASDGSADGLAGVARSRRQVRAARFVGRDGRGRRD